jgi:hypothetical protein
LCIVSKSQQHLLPSLLNQPKPKLPRDRSNQSESDTTTLHIDKPHPDDDDDDRYQSFPIAYPNTEILRNSQRLKSRLARSFSTYSQQSLVNINFIVKKAPHRTAQTNPNNRTSNKSNPSSPNTTNLGKKWKRAEKEIAAAVECTRRTATHELRGDGGNETGEREG